MKTPLRLGATAALGALLLVGLLASPALAWVWDLSAEAVCEEGGTTARVDFTVQSQEAGANADVTVVALVDGKRFGKPVTGSFGPDNDTVTGSFPGVPLDAESVFVRAIVHWTEKDKTESKKVGVDLPTDCGTTPTTTTPPPTTTPATTTPATTAPPTTAPTTTQGGGILPTTTTGGPQLPFTGANSGPLLLGAIVLVGGGFVILWASRLRGRHETR
jgi:hypothetical protein